MLGWWSVVVCGLWFGCAVVCLLLGLALVVLGQGPLDMTNE